MGDFFSDVKNKQIEKFCNNFHYVSYKKHNKTKLKY